MDKEKLDKIGKVYGGKKMSKSKIKLVLYTSNC